MTRGTCLHFGVSSGFECCFCAAGVGLRRPLPPQNERRPGSGCGDLTGSGAEEEYTGDGLGKVRVFKWDYYGKLNLCANLSPGGESHEF